MISYSRNEIFSATQAAKKFGDILKRFKDKTLQRAAISRNNAIKAIILPVEEYEKIQEIAEMAEMQEIAALVEARKNSPKTYPLEEVLNEHGIDYNEI